MLCTSFRSLSTCSGLFGYSLLIHLSAKRANCDPCSAVKERFIVWRSGSCACAPWTAFEHTNRAMNTRICLYTSSFFLTRIEANKWGCSADGQLKRIGGIFPRATHGDRSSSYFTIVPVRAQRVLAKKSIRNICRITSRAESITNPTGIREIPVK